MLHPLSRSTDASLGTFAAVLTLLRPLIILLAAAAPVLPAQVLTTGSLLLVGGALVVTILLAADLLLTLSRATSLPKPMAKPLSAHHVRSDQFMKVSLSRASRHCRVASMATVKQPASLSVWRSFTQLSLKTSQPHRIEHNTPCSR